MSKVKRRKWEEISDMLTPKGMAELRAGQTLTFDYEGFRTTLRIMRMTKTQCWAKLINLYTSDEFDVIDTEPEEGEIVEEGRPQ